MYVRYLRVSSNIKIPIYVLHKIRLKLGVPSIWYLKYIYIEKIIF